MVAHIDDGRSGGAPHNGVDWLGSSDIALLLGFGNEEQEWRRLRLVRRIVALDFSSAGPAMVQVVR